MTLLLLLLTLAMSCSSISDQQLKGASDEYVHKNNLTIRLPKDLVAKESGNGFIVELADGAGNKVRVPVEIQVGLFDDKSNIFTDGNLTKTKAVNDRNIKYQIDKDEGGSGGETFTFIGYETIDKGYIKYSQSTQSKYGEPDFSLLWQIIENTSVKK